MTRVPEKGGAFSERYSQNGFGEVRTVRNLMTQLRRRTSGTRMPKIIRACRGKERRWASKRADFDDYGEGPIRLCRTGVSEDYVEKNGRVNFVTPERGGIAVYFAVGGDGEVLGGRESGGVCGETFTDRIKKNFNAEFAEISRERGGCSARRGGF